MKVGTGGRGRTEHLNTIFLQTHWWPLFWPILQHGSTLVFSSFNFCIKTSINWGHPKKTSNVTTQTMATIMLQSSQSIRHLEYLEPIMVLRCQAHGAKRTNQIPVLYVCRVHLFNMYSFLGPNNKSFNSGHPTSEVWNSILIFRYYVPDSARPMLGRKFWKNEMAICNRLSPKKKGNPGFNGFF